MDRISKRIFAAGRGICKKIMRAVGHDLDMRGAFSKDAERFRKRVVDAAEGRD
jgi:hypothetical protein